MKITAQEEYGLRLLIRIASYKDSEVGTSVPQLSEAEGLTSHYTAKLCRALRLGGYINQPLYSQALSCFTPWRLYKQHTR